MKIPTPASDQARALGLGHREPEQHAAAEQTIRNMGPDAIPFLLQVLQEQTRRARRLRIYPILSLASFCCFLLLLLVLLLRSHESVGIGLIMTPFLHLSYIFLIPWFCTSTSLRRDVGLLFAQLATREQVGALIDLWEQVEGDNARAVDKALTRIFSQMQASDSHYLTIPHRQKLARLLMRLADSGNEANARLIIALLRGLMQVGDSSFIEPVTHVLTRGGRSIGGRVEAVAQECLPYLEAFAEQEQRSGTLVRPATSPGNEEASGRLVRPAASTPPHTEALLRPVGREDTE